MPVSNSRSVSRNSLLRLVRMEGVFETLQRFKTSFSFYVVAGHIQNSGKQKRFTAVLTRRLWDIFHIDYRVCGIALQ